MRIIITYQLEKKNTLFRKRYKYTKILCDYKLSEQAEGENEVKRDSSFHTAAMVSVMGELSALSLALTVPASYVFGFAALFACPVA